MSRPQYFTIQELAEAKKATNVTEALTAIGFKRVSKDELEPSRCKAKEYLFK